MIDTLQLELPIEIPEIIVEKACDRSLKNKPDGFLVHYSYTKQLKNIHRANIYITYYPNKNDHKKKPRLCISFSVPKILYGENVSMISDEQEIFEAVSCVNQTINDEKWLPKIDLLEECVIGRLDLCFNHQVEDRVSEYLQVISKLNHPDHDNKTVDPDKEVLFHSKKAATKFYDKHKERKPGKKGQELDVSKDLSNSVGILRQELTYRRNWYIKLRMGIDYSPKVADIHKEWIKQRLEKDLDSLGLLNRVVCPGNQALRILRSKYENMSTVIRLYGYLCTRQIMDKKDLIEAGFSKDSIRRNESDLKEVGLSNQMTDNENYLPPLVINI